MHSVTATVARGASASRVTLTLGALALLFSLAPGGPDAWLLDHSAVLASQPWRLLTAHLAHSDPVHLAWNLLGLAVLGAAFEPLLRWRLWAVLAAAALAIDAWFYLADPGLARYCGLSGALNGLLVLGLIEWHRRSGDRLPVLIGIGALGKTLVELFYGVTVFTELAWQPVPEAHLIGMAAAVAWWAAEHWTRRRERGREIPCTRRHSHGPAE